MSPEINLAPGARRIPHPLRAYWLQERENPEAIAERWRGPSGGCARRSRSAWKASSTRSTAATVKAWGEPKTDSNTKTYMGAGHGGSSGRHDRL